MKLEIKEIQDSFEIGYNNYAPSRAEAQEVLDLLHNRHYTQTQLAVLSNRKQPAETFNVIKTFHRMFIGYFSSVVNTIKITPRKTDDIVRAAICNDTIQYILDQNEFNFIKDELNSDLITVGYCAYSIGVEKTGEIDEVGRDIFECKLGYVNPLNTILDPLAVAPDYSDARFIHEFKWVSEEVVIQEFGKSKLKDLEEYDNHLNVTGADFTDTYNEQFMGRYKLHNNYLIVYSIIRDETDQLWNVFWSGDTILYKSKVSFKHLNFPLKVIKANKSDKAEYYGLFREIVETQKAINQALLQIQLLVNTNKIFYEGDAVGNPKEFERLVSRVNAIIPVNRITGIDVKNLSGDILQQYKIIDSALARIQRILSINDSFLGMSDASSSGRKVKLLQNASVIALRYITNKVEYMHKVLGKDLVGVIRQYYTAHQVLGVTDINESMGQRWIEINVPFLMPTGEVAEDGTPDAEVLTVPEEDEDGYIRQKVINERDTDLDIQDVNIKVDVSVYNETDDIERVFMDSILQGPVGQAIQSASPAAYFRLIAISLEAAKTRSSYKVAEVVNALSTEMEGAGIMDPRMVPSRGGGGASSGALMDAAGMTNFANPDQGTNGGDYE